MPTTSPSVTWGAIDSTAHREMTQFPAQKLLRMRMFLYLMIPQTMLMDRFQMAYSISATMPSDFPQR
jgi:hypothetical protein